MSVQLWDEIPELDLIIWIQVWNVFNRNEISNGQHNDKATKEQTGAAYGSYDVALRSVFRGNSNTINSEYVECVKSNYETRYLPSMTAEFPMIVEKISSWDHNENIERDNHIANCMSIIQLS